jgi:hypothetical protein
VWQWLEILISLALHVIFCLLALTPYDFIEFKMNFPLTCCHHCYMSYHPNIHIIHSPIHIICHTSGYPWPSDTVKSARSEWRGEGGGQKKTKLSNIFGWFWVCNQRYRSMITVVYFISGFIASFGTIFLRKVATFFYGRSPLWLQTKNLWKKKTLLGRT